MNFPFAAENTEFLYDEADLLTPEEEVELAERMSQEDRDSFAGQEVSVLLEEPGEDGYMIGYTKEYIRVQKAGGTELAGQQVYGKIACRNGKYILE